MFSQTLNRPIALVAAANVVGGGAYGIVNATAGKQLRHPRRQPHTPRRRLRVLDRVGEHFGGGVAAGHPDAVRESCVTRKSSATRIGARRASVFNAGPRPRRDSTAG